jgi:peptidase E
MPDLLPQPVLLLAGGPGRSPAFGPLLQPFFADLPPEPAIAYIGAASGDDNPFLRWATSWLNAAGAGAVRLIPTVNPPTRDPAEWRRLLDPFPIIFINGGDVEEGMALLDQCNLSNTLRELQAEGIRFLGLSAGSIMLSREWVRWQDPEDPESAERFPCLGIAPVFCDTHAEEDEWEELRALLTLQAPGAIGYGIPSDGALWVESAHKVQPLSKPAPVFRRETGGIVTLPALKERVDSLKHVTEAD